MKEEMGTRLEHAVGVGYVAQV